MTGEWQVNLLRSSTKIETVKGPTEAEAWGTCVESARAKTDASGTLHKCQTPVYVARKTTDPTPTCPNLPPVETRSQPCPAGSTGEWSQSRSYTAAAYPTCAIAGEWVPTSPPAGACTVTPPPPPPTTGDTIRHGQTFTVTGANFGTKPKAAPFVYDTFDVGTGSPGGKAGTAGKWTACDWSSAISYATHDGRKVARHAFGGGTYNASLCADVVTNTFYLDFWMKGVAKANPSRNWKTWRTYSTGGSENGNTVYYCSGGGIDLGGWKWLPEGPPPQGWVHYQIVSTPSVTQHYRNGTLDHQGRGGATIAELRLGHYWGLDGVPECSSNPGADVYTDDAYFDTSIARVLLADAPIFANAKLTAIQLPTAWADGAVTIAPDTSRFKVGDKAYVLVIDAGNVQRKAQEVTVE